MTGKTYVRWYEENPEKVALLAVIDHTGETCLARQILWTTDQGVTSASPSHYSGQDRDEGY